MMKLRDYRYTGKQPLVLKKLDTHASDEIKVMKDELIERTAENLERAEALQEQLYAAGREGLVIVLQALDGAGKDSMIKHVISGLNPQGVDVHAFKAPTAPELKHDFLWRIGRCLPERGRIAIFNRSHYEDVLAVDVLKLYEHFTLPQRCLEGDFIQKRRAQIAAFEEYLYENGTRVVKIFLNISKDEQRKRFLERLDKPEKHWKFEPADMKTRALFDDYLAAYEQAINGTATKHCPWYVLPADDKWFTRYLVSEILVDVLERIDPKYPELNGEAAQQLPTYRAQLLSE